jgi:regulator of cell morphogenesis and NO signaling
MALSPHTAVGQLVAEEPARARIFEALDIDYCCGGDQTLAAACQAHDLDPDTVVRMLDTLPLGPSASASTDWTEAPLGDLIDHIVDAHHGFLRRELPRLHRRLEKVTRAHGADVAWLSPVADLFTTLKHELEDHMESEESYVFPAIRTLAQGRVLPDGSTLDTAAVEQMVAEHDEAGTMLQRLRNLTNDYTPPPNACSTFRATLDGLRKLEADMHQHVHKENNILFPRARRLG